MSFMLSLINVVYSSNSHVLTLLRKMIWRNIKIVILFMWFGVSYGIWVFPNIYGIWMSSLLPILSIRLPVRYYKARLIFISFSLLVHYFLSSIVSLGVHILFKIGAPLLPNLMIRSFIVSSLGIPQCPRGIGIMILSLVICTIRWMSLF